ncbi:MAG: bifunctional 3-deoxy-7-phosphoheptulonate synthase/chorismate mutase type II [Muribaculaceae bacterium]|nr:bifunctional 3-deoxy-7-phosphoheptulonate synthase/chorismate mutase type II [Muribaculaceae bacterium]
MYRTELLPGLDPKKPLIICGPCSAETEDQVLETARQLASYGAKVFRAGIWKPRTKPGGFEGVGVEGLPWLRKVKEETGMYVSTEVATKAHVEAALEAGVDLLWIGARTAANPFAMQEIADTLAALGKDVPVLVKNPVNPDLELWIGAIQRIQNAGVKRVGAIHRGFSAYGKHLYRNMPQWHIPIELGRRMPDIPIICDPSHIGGKRELIAPLSQQAFDMGFDGLIIESHCNPDEAWSDAAQQITPDVLNIIVNSLVPLNGAKPDSTESLTLLRQEIDRIDNDLVDMLGKRMRICREIGQYKKEHGMKVVQGARYSDMMKSREVLAREMQMSEEFIRRVYAAIHEESVRQQIEMFKAK